jgi:hypothetical protein
MSLIVKVPVYLGYVVVVVWFFYRVSTGVVLLIFASKKVCQSKVQVLIL